MFSEGNDTFIAYLKAIVTNVVITVQNASVEFQT